MINLIVILLYVSLIIWVLGAILVYQRQLAKEKGESLIAVRLNIFLPFILLFGLIYGTLFLQPAVYSITHRLPTTVNVKDVVKKIAMLIQIAAIIFYPMYAWGDILANLFNREIRGSQKVDEDLRRQSNALRNVILFAFCLGTLLLILANQL